MSEQRWWERYWAQLSSILAIVGLVILAAVSFWLGGWHKDQHAGDVAPVVPSLSEVAVIQVEVTHIKDSLKEIKDAQTQNQLEIIRIIRESRQ